MPLQMTEPQMNLQDNLVDQLENAVSGKSIAKRADVLKRVTDLFLSGSGLCRGSSDVETCAWSPIVTRQETAMG